MRINLENISKVRKADIEIDGITVIAGENNTGKSTVGKALWSIFNSFYDITNEIQEERKKLIEIRLKYNINFFDERVSREQINKISTILLRELPKTKKEIENIIWENIEVEAISVDILDKIAKEIDEILNLEDRYILKKHLQGVIQSEFNGQVNSIYNRDDGKIKLTITGKEMEIILNSQNIKDIRNDKVIINTKALYIDDPFVLDRNNGVSFMEKNHKSDLKELLISKIKKNENIVENAIIEKKLERINEKLNSVFKDEIEFNFYDKKVKVRNSSEELDIKNLSTGLKTFVILKNLISNGILETRGTIILDEPEIHLHPEWQLLFAEIIVLLQKELELHILLATHSPYFLRAIQVYAGNHGIADKCRYYLAKNEGNFSVIEDVSNNVELIFEKLARPLQKLEDLLYDKV